SMSNAQTIQQMPAAAGLQGFAHSLQNPSQTGIAPGQAMPANQVAAQVGGGIFSDGQPGSGTTPMTGMQNMILFRNGFQSLPMEQSDPMKVRPLSSPQMAADILKLSHLQVVAKPSAGETILAPQAPHVSLSRVPPSFLGVEALSQFRAQQAT